MQLHYIIIDSWLWRHWITQTCPWSNTFFFFLSQLECCTSTLKTAHRLCWMEIQPQACTLFTSVEMRVSPCRSTAIWPLMEAAGLWVILSQITCRTERFAVLILEKVFNGIDRSKMETLYPTCHSKCVSPKVFCARMKVMQGLEWYEGNKWWLNLNFQANYSFKVKSHQTQRAKTQALIHKSRCNIVVLPCRCLWDGRVVKWSFSETGRTTQQALVTWTMNSGWVCLYLCWHVQLLILP